MLGRLTPRAVLRGCKPLYTSHSVASYRSGTSLTALGRLPFKRMKHRNAFRRLLTDSNTGATLYA